MHYTIIDMEKDPRCGQFAYFRAMQYPFASVTVEVDITDMMTARGSRPFFLSLLYAVVRAANAVPQLRRRILPDGRVAEYDWCPPSYTAMKPDGVYVYCTVEGDMPYGTFIAEGQRRQREVLERGTLTEDGDVRSFFFVSSVPWVHYSQLQHPAESPDDSNPRISWGKYVTVNGRTTLPPMEREQKRFLVYIAKEITTMSHPYHGLNELREMFLKFFETKGHLRLPSFSLVPQNDKSILLINAGMTPMKPWFKGEEEPPCRRVCTCQKCIRTGDMAGRDRHS